MVIKIIAKMCAERIRNHSMNGGSHTQAMIAASIDHLQFFYRLRRKYFTKKVSAKASSIVRQLKKNGIYVIENYWSKDRCFAAINEVDKIIANYPEYVHPHAKADKRVFGANNASELIAEFHSDKLLLEVATAYNKEPTVAAFTLGARMPYTDGNLGSGEGWHRDAPSRQFKSILYLTDVGIENGPFQMLGQSHNLKNKLLDTMAGRLNYPQFRITQDQVDSILAKNPGRLGTYVAKAGTLILADVSGIHRGMPIRTGTRYALTNYYYPVNQIDDELIEKFKVLPSEDVSAC